MGWPVRLEYLQRHRSLAAAVAIQTALFVGCDGSDEVTTPIGTGDDEELVDVRTLGADNTGGTDSAPVLQQAIDDGMSLLFPAGTYRIDAGLSFTSDSARYVFEDAVLTSPNVIRLVTIRGNSISIEGMTIDMADRSVEKFAIEVLQPSRAIRLKDCSVFRLHGVAGGKFQVALRIDLDGVDGFEVSGCRFEHIALPNDGNATEFDFASGVYLNWPQALVNPSRGTISDCTFRDIHNPTATSDARIDADAIRIRAESDPSPVSGVPRLVITRCNFFDCQKRAIKISGMSNVEIRDIDVMNERTEDIDQQEAVRVFGGVAGVVIADVTVSGNVSRGVWLSEARGVTVEDLAFEQHAKLTGTSSWAIRIEGDPAGPDVLREIVCRNVTVRNAKALKIGNATNIEVRNVVVENVEPLVTQLDDVFELSDSRNVMVIGAKVLTNATNVPTALRVTNCRGVTLRDCEFRGWGNPVVQVTETAGRECSEVVFDGGSVEQVGYLPPGTADGATVRFRSNNDGSQGDDGISGVVLRRWTVSAAKQPASLVDYYAVCFLETPGASLNQVSIHYGGDTLESINSLLRLTHASGTRVDGMTISSNSAARAIYLTESLSTEFDNVDFCGIAASRMTVDMASNDARLDTFYRRSDFVFEGVAPEDARNCLAGRR